MGSIGRARDAEATKARIGLVMWSPPVGVLRFAALAIIGVGIQLPLSGHVSGQQIPWEVPRTEHGHPDLQGNWSNATITPIQRSPSQPNLVLTADQVAEMEGAVVERLEEGLAPVNPEDRPDLQGTADLVQAYDEFFWDRGSRVAVVHGEPRSSLITFPENGRVPPLSAEGERRIQAQREFQSQFDPYDHPELRPLAERCLMSFGGNTGPPIVPNYSYNNNYTIVQTADYVMIYTEMIHDARIIRLDDSPRLPQHIRPWMGDARGRWEGDVLVVETTNIHPVQGVMGQFIPMNYSEAAKVTERFTRVDDRTILLEFTVDDPLTWTEPWGGEVPMWAFDDLLYEYACHEGNYGFEAVLSGARYQERMEREGNEP